MSAKVVPEPARFFRELSLHDVTITQVSYDLDIRHLEIRTDDLNWNIEGTEGYRPRPCVLHFAGVTAFELSMGRDRFHTSINSEPAILNDASAITRNGVTRMDFVFSTSEHWSVEFVTLEIEDDL